MRSPSEPLTMSVRDYAAASGLSEYAVRQEVASGSIPHRRIGRRGLVRILRIPALQQLGFDAELTTLDPETAPK
jgi:hypothetical protein